MQNSGSFSFIKIIKYAGEVQDQKNKGGRKQCSLRRCREWPKTIYLSESLKQQHRIVLLNMLNQRTAHKEKK